MGRGESAYVLCTLADAGSCYEVGTMCNMNSSYALLTGHADCSRPDTFSTSSKDPGLPGACWYSSTASRPELQASAMRLRVRRQAATCCI